MAQIQVQTQIQPKIIHYKEVFYKKVGRKILVIIRIWPHPTMGAEWYKSPFRSETQRTIGMFKDIADILVGEILRGPYYCSEYETAGGLYFQACLTNRGIIVDVFNLND